MWLSKPIVCSRVYDWRWKQAKLIYKSNLCTVLFWYVGSSIGLSVCLTKEYPQRERAFWTTQRHAFCRFLGGQLQPSHLPCTSNSPLATKSWHWLSLASEVQQWRSMCLDPKVRQIVWFPSWSTKGLNQTRSFRQALSGPWWAGWTSKGSWCCGKRSPNGKWRQSKCRSLGGTVAASSDSWPRRSIVHAKGGTTIPAHSCETYVRNYHVSGLGLNILLNRRHFFAIRPHGCTWTRNIEQMTKYASKSSRSTKDEINQRHSVFRRTRLWNLPEPSSTYRKESKETSIYIYLGFSRNRLSYICPSWKLLCLGVVPPFPPFSAAVWLPPEHRLDSMRCELLFAGLLPQFLTRQDGEGMRGWTWLKHVEAREKIQLPTLGFETTIWKNFLSLLYNCQRNEQWWPNHSAPGTHLGRPWSIQTAILRAHRWAQPERKRNGWEGNRRGNRRYGR